MDFVSYERIWKIKVGSYVLKITISICITSFSSLFFLFSSNFVFPPGIGLPGRVLSSGQPLWDDSIPQSCEIKFPRVEGARAHGIQKGVGIPLYHTPYGKVIVAMYSTQDIRRDVGLVQKCCQFFQGSHGIGQMVSRSIILSCNFCHKQLSF